MFSPVKHSNKQIALSFCVCSAVEIHTSPLTLMMEMDGFVDVMMGFMLSVLCFRHISFSFINCPHRFWGWEATQVVPLYQPGEKEIKKQSPI